MLSTPLPRASHRGTRQERTSFQPPIAMLGVPFDWVTLDQAAERISNMVASRQPHYVVTPNVDFLVQARHDEELRRTLIDAELVLCDGTPLVWASRWLGNPLPGRVAGADLTPKLIEMAAQKGWRLFLLGGAPGVTEQAAASLRRAHPNLIIAGHFSPPFLPLLEMNHDQILAQVKAAQPDLLLVSFGCPKAEKWIAMHYRSLEVPVVIGVGATIDFLAGRVKRAPLWMQRAGLEWTYRLWQEPRRLFHRYATDLIEIGTAMFIQWWRLQVRLGRRPNDNHAAPAPLDCDEQIIRIPESLDATRARNSQWSRAIERPTALDLSQVRFIDSTGLGLLLFLRKKLRQIGCHLVLIAPSAVVWRALRLMRVEELFVVANTTEEARHLLRNQPDRVRCVSTNDGTPRMSWSGEITAANAREVWISTEPALRCPALDKLPMTIDLSHLRFIDSAGIDLMLRAKRMAETQGTTLRFTGATQPVREVLRLTQRDTLLLK